MKFQPVEKIIKLKMALIIWIMVTLTDKKGKPVRKAVEYMRNM